MKALLAVVLLIVVCDAYGPDSNFGKSEPCSHGHQFDRLVAPRCHGDECFAHPGSLFHLEFAGRNHEAHPIDVFVWAHIQGIGHSEDSFYYSSGCHDDFTSYPCIARPNESITGRLAIRLPKSFKEGLARITFEVHGVGCGRMYVRVSN
uniref:Putative salivary secreted protein n=1 Tax=Ornithodoros parkeri TaxID=140564 RepID=A6NA06_ORNPR|nr:putative salivary secreted protein [Ornithodoros parkeri]